MTHSKIYPVHPAAEVLPLMPEERLDELVTDIKAHGLHKPIEVYEEQIIEGRNRLAACERAGITPDYKDVTGSIDDPYSYVASMNLHRRDLTNDQRAACFAELATRSRGRPAGTKNPSTGGFTDRDAAKAARVPLRTLQRAKHRMRTDPEAHVAAKAGKTPKRAATIKAPRAARGNKKDAAKEKLAKCAAGWCKTLGMQVGTPPAGKGALRGLEDLIEHRADLQPLTRQNLIELLRRTSAATQKYANALADGMDVDSAVANAPRPVTTEQPPVKRQH